MSESESGGDLCEEETRRLSIPLLQTVRGNEMRVFEEFRRRMMKKMPEGSANENESGNESASLKDDTFELISDHSSSEQLKESAILTLRR
jgi:hypothetical protein